MVVENLSLPEQVGPALLKDLGGRLGMPGLRFAQPPEQITHGWEAYTYAFRLACEGLEPAWARPLIVRIYAGADQGLQANREGAVQRFVGGIGYHVAQLLAVETNVGALGYPFLVMERVAGTAMLDFMKWNPRRAFRLTALMAETHVALHRLPVEGWPLRSAEPLVNRNLANFRRWPLEFELHGLGKPPAWLENYKDAVIPEEPSLCHNDFHPYNIVVGDNDRLTVIDWGDASVGDRHSDVASTIVLARSVTREPPSIFDRVLDPLARRIFMSWFLRCYRRHLPLDAKRLAYWEALHAFKRWIGIVAMQSLRSADFPVKPGAARRLPAAHLARAQRYFWQAARHFESEDRLHPGQTPLDEYSVGRPGPW